MNTATIIGRAGQDAEIKYFESGKVKTTFSLAVGRWDSKTKEEVTDLSTLTNGDYYYYRILVRSGDTNVYLEEMNQIQFSDDYIGA